MTWSPGLTLVTPSPTSTTMPAPSWPSTAGKTPSGSSPLRVKASVWQTPVCVIFTSTSPFCGGATSISTICRGSPALNATAARDFIGGSPGRIRRGLRGAADEPEWPCPALPGQTMTVEHALLCRRAVRALPLGCCAISVRGDVHWLTSGSIMANLAEPLHRVQVDRRAGKSP